MRIGALNFKPFIYNTNSLNRNSLNKISAISEDLPSRKTDFTGLAAADRNENPLRKGETSNFTDVFQKQFYKGRQNASMLFQPSERSDEFFLNKASSQNLNAMQRAIEAYQSSMIA